MTNTSTPSTKVQGHVSAGPPTRGGGMLQVGGVDLYVTARGDGPTIVLVHGSLTDRQAWRFIEPELTAHHCVVTYDRRGHSNSTTAPVATNRCQEEDDLIALIEVLDLGPTHLVGSSYGASIALATASRRPDLVRGVVAHEPPLLDLAAGPVIDETRHALHGIGRKLAEGDVEAGVQSFVDVILGPGGWANVPELTRSTMLANASTVPAMLADRAWAALDTELLAAGGVPVLLTEGSASPAWLRTIVAAMVDAIPSVQAHTYEGAGHMPHVTHPAELVAAIGSSVVQAT